MPRKCLKCCCGCAPLRSGEYANHTADDTSLFAGTSSRTVFHNRPGLVVPRLGHSTGTGVSSACGFSAGGSLESAIQRPYCGYFRPIQQKAAVLVESICRNHRFVDGNKRTAVVCLEILLANSGYELQPSGDEDLNDALVEIVERIATHELNSDAIEQWMRARIRKLATQ